MLDSVKSWASKGVYLGTSSWKYPGWQNLLYKRTYSSKKKFDDECLEEYVEHFSSVGLDHTYYNWPQLKTFDHYMEQTKDDFRFGIKATENITVFKYPKHKRYGHLAGTYNEHFLDADMFIHRFLDPLSPYKSRIGPIMLEFSQFYPGMVGSGHEFCERLGQFLSKLPSDWLYAVELRNKSWLQPAYFDMLLKHQVCHVYNSWTRMPRIGEQLELTQNYSFPAYVSRVLLEPGVQYQEAVENFSPYNKICIQHDELRNEAASVARRAVQVGVPAYIFVNNRAEGCALKTIEGIVDNLEST